MIDFLMENPVIYLLALVAEAVLLNMLWMWGENYWFKNKKK